MAAAWTCRHPVPRRGADGQGFRKFKKQEKMDPMVAVCTVLVPQGFYEFKGRDDDGWPHFEERFPAGLGAEGTGRLIRALVDISERTRPRSSAREALECRLVLDDDVLAFEGHPPVGLEVAEGPDQALLGGAHHASEILPAELGPLFSFLEAGL